jgi:hypothetical protein
VCRDNPLAAAVLTPSAAVFFLSQNLSDRSVAKLKLVSRSIQRAAGMQPGQQKRRNAIMKDQFWAGLLTAAMILVFALISIFAPNSPLIF